MSKTRKVASEELKPGMFVVELDRPWEEVPFEWPFEIQGFTISSLEELKRVKEFCEFVYIDPSMGLGAERYLDSGERRPWPAPAAIGELPDVERALADPVYPERLTVLEEMALAREVVADTRQVYRNVLQDIQGGRPINTQAVESTVKSLVESLLRNPEASALLVRLKHRDQYSYTHAMSVTVYGVTLGRQLGLPEEELTTLGMTLLMQDVGKAHLPSALLMKRGGINYRERQLLKRHVEASGQMLKAQAGLPGEVLEVVQEHHERYDRSGYPRGLGSDEISLAGHIAGLVDTYAAMTAVRPWRPARTSFETLMYLYERRDKQFRGALVEHLIHCVGIFPVGSFVLLNSGEVGVVISRNRTAQLRPRVMLILDRAGRRLDKPRTIDLARQEPGTPQRPWKITRMVDPRAYGLDPGEFFA